MTAGESPQAAAPGAGNNPSIPPVPPPAPRTLASISNPEARRTMARFLNW